MTRNTNQEANMNTKSTTEPQDILYVRRTRATDGFYLSYIEHGENRDRIWYDFRSKSQLAGWATLHGYQIVFVD